ncbi:MAG: hypothetical protein CL678_13315 [Bdellovibrionaceae bacterium]|nr:hypothetical protein [Pseudobdellovibrionaceae bacterium]|tara:strand:- start:782 stop:2557 length:1776 start_codon:yes stop_codon:yes gene_type:complete
MAIEWKNGTPISSDFDDVYYSVDDGKEESYSVFIDGNDLPEKLEKFSYIHIVELGFGTGLNFLNFWEAWKKSKNKPRVYFQSVEKYPLSLEQIRKALQKWNFPLDLFLENYTPEGIWKTSFENGKIQLEVYFEEVNQFSVRPEVSQIDVLFLDGFNPKKNPQMWTKNLFETLRKKSTHRVSFSTFTSQSQVRKNLEDAGFDVEKVSGFGKKRERLKGRRNKNPHLYLGTLSFQVKKVGVVGAGLAGSAIADALAKRGVQVEVFDVCELPAQKTSGNPAALYHPSLSQKRDEILDWNEQAYQFLLRELNSRPEVIHEKSGSYLTWKTESKQQRYQKASQLNLKIPVEYQEEQNRIYFPKGGWVSPVSLVNSRLNHSLIRFIGETTVNSYRKENQGWILETSLGDQGPFDAIVFANGMNLLKNKGMENICLKPVRGQVFTIKKQLNFSRPVQSDAYVIPMGAHFLLGATHDLKINSEEPRAGAFEEVMEKASDLFSGKVDYESTRVGVRVTTLNHFPIIGPWSPFLKNINSSIDMTYEMPPLSDGLFVFTGLGSRGVLYSGMASECLVQWIFKERRTMKWAHRLLPVVHLSRC